MNSNMKITIVGGGPAGAYLGYCLAKDGVKATIFDDSHPREKPCGGGISSLAIKKFPILHEIPVGKAPGKKIKLISPSGKVAVVEGEMESWAVSRLHMDKFLLEKAVEEGTNLIEERVVKIEEKNRKWIIQTKNGKIYKSDIIVGADGVNSIVRKSILKPIEKENLGICYGYFSRGIEEEDTIIKYLKNIEGYAWVFPREDHFSVGIGVELANASLGKIELEKFVRTYARNMKIFEKWGALIPLIKNVNFYRYPTSGDNWIVIGDAAGHVDPITGEGILYALWSAEIAAKALLNENPNLFDNLWRKEYGWNLVEAVKMRSMFFNDVLLELSIIIAKKSRTFGKLLYDVTNSEQDYKTFNKVFFKKIPKIFLEFLF